MAVFLTKYPRRIGFMEGIHDFILNEEIQFDHLSLMVRVKKDELINTLITEGFKRVIFENKKPTQIGSGFAKMIIKPWELHVRLLDLQQQGLIAIQAEVEISRKYIQHIRSVRAPVIYEIETILKKHKIEYQIWNAKVRDYIINIIDNHQIKLNSPKFPAMRWRSMLFFAAVIAMFNAMKFVGIL